MHKLLLYNVYAKAIHVLPTDFAISHEVSLDSGCCQGFIDFSAAV